MKLEKKIMEALAGFVIQYHKLIPPIAFALCALSILAARNIRVTTQIKDLLPSKNPQVQSIEEINEHFSGGTTLLITIEGTEKKEMAACAEAFAGEVRKDENIMKYVKAINVKFDRDFITDWGFLLQKSKDIERSSKTLSNLNLLPFITSLNDSFESTYTGVEAEEELSTHSQEKKAVAMLNQLEMFFTLLKTYLEDPEAEEIDLQGKKLAETFLLGDLYHYSFDNTMLMFSITPNITVDDIDSMIDMMSGIEEIRKKIQNQFPNLKIGYTGEVAMGADEQQALGFDMLVPAVVALGVILLLFLFSFSHLRSIAFAVFTLTFGIVLTYGFVGITIGKITMITSFMAVLLIGLGIDYGIQIATNFNTFREDGHSPKDAIRLTYTHAGMGTLLAAVTTAVAFFIMAATGSNAFAQFGIIAGVGIMLCFLSMLFILPSFLLWFGKKNISSSRFPHIHYRFLSKLGIFFNKKRWVTLSIALVVTAGLFIAAFLNQFEYDMMKLEPQNMTAFITFEKVTEKFDITPLPAKVIADDLEEARALTNALEKKYSVREVNSIANYLPSDTEQKARLAAIQKIKNAQKRYNPDYRYSKTDMNAFTQEIQRLEWNVIEIGDLSAAGLGEDNRILQKRNRMIREIFGAEAGEPGREVFQKLIQLIAKNPAMYAERLTHLDASFAKEMDSIIGRMIRVDRKITITDIPDSITHILVEKGSTRNLVIIYPEKNVMDDVQNMRRFNDTLADISPKISGWTQILISWTEEVISESQEAAIYIFLAVFLFMLISFRSLRYSILASIPLFIGMIWLFGLYPLLGMKLNVMNVVVIPLVIGMGIDFGIHIVHRFIVEKEIETVYRSTGKAIFLSALTTMIGFGSLALIGSFPSIVSIGTVLFLGIATCLAATMVVLPVFLNTQKNVIHRKIENRFSRRFRNE
jgi:predicted RND superfamily exporter protein